jgi:hypothetical protein
MIEDNDMRLLLLAIILTTLLPACGRHHDSKKSQEETPKNQDDSQKILWSLDWEIEPTANTEKNAAILAIDANGQDVTLTDIDPQMPAHGHGTVKTYQKIEKLAGAEQVARFRVTGFYFVMPGDWQIDVIAEVGGVEEKHSFAVEVR